MYKKSKNKRKKRGELSPQAIARRQLTATLPGVRRQLRTQAVSLGSKFENELAELDRELNLLRQDIKLLSGRRRKVRQRLNEFAIWTKKDQDNSKFNLPSVKWVTRPDYSILVQDLFGEDTDEENTLSGFPTIIFVGELSTMLSELSPNRQFVINCRIRGKSFKEIAGYLQSPAKRVERFYETTLRRLRGFYAVWLEQKVHDFLDSGKVDL